MADTSSLEKPKLVIACVACRHLKTKCTKTDDDDEKCDRCKRLKLECQFTQKKRGRRTAAELAERTKSAVNASARSPAQRAAEDGPSGTEEADEGDENVDVAMDIRPTANLGAGTLGLALPGGFQTAFFDHNPQLPDSSSVGTGLDHVIPTPRPLPCPTSTITAEDPVYLCVLSEVESRYLVEMYMTHLNPLVNLLDPVLHTFEYIRSTSTVLFVLVLAAAARFFNHPLHSRLLSHGHTMIIRFTSNGEHCDIGLIQAVIIAVYWKEAQDTSVWIKIGMAIRLGHQLGLHLPHQRVDIQDQVALRVKHDKERTWYNLICLDHSYADLSKLPRMIQRRHIQDPTRWLMDATIRIPENGNVACSVNHLLSVDLSELTDPYIELSRGSSQLIVERMIHTLSELRQKWFTEGGLSDYLNPRTSGIHRWLNAQRLLRLRQLAVTLEFSDALPQAMTAVVQTVEHVEAASDRDGLKYAPNILVSSMSELAGFMHKIYPQVEASHQLALITLLRRLHACCATGDGPSAPATAFMGGFIARTLRTLGFSTRANTRAPTPDVALHGGMVDLPFQGDGLDPFGLPHQFNLDLDGEYWASIFAGIPGASTQR